MSLIPRGILELAIVSMQDIAWLQYIDTGDLWAQVAIVIRIV